MPGEVVRSRLQCRLHRNLQGGKADPGQTSSRNRPAQSAAEDRADGVKAGRIVGRPRVRCEVAVREWGSRMTLQAKPSIRSARKPPSAVSVPGAGGVEMAHIRNPLSRSAAGDSFYSHDDY